MCVLNVFGKLLVFVAGLLNQPDDVTVVVFYRSNQSTPADIFDLLH
jgi:hypothetical protein